jgi:hypothetical protein
VAADAVNDSTRGRVTPAGYGLIVDRARSRRCRALLITSGLALLWAWSISFSGGFFLRLGQVRISSRNPNHPLLTALLALAAAWITAPRGLRWPTLVSEWCWLAGKLDKVIPRLTASQMQRLVTGTAGLLAVTVLWLGLTRGAFVAGGPDPYGYVSQATLWLTGIPRIELPQAGLLPDGVPLEALVPLGYRLATNGTSLVPSYSPGFPMQMALMERLGPQDSMFFVMPVLAAVAVWATYRLGTMLAGRAAGLIAALFLATSPAVLLQLTNMPMSDIPAMAWWTVALVLLPRSSRISALLMGAAVGVAILTRPNLAPLALILGAFLAWDIAANRVARSVPVQRVVFFGVGSVSACLTIAYLNNYWYGSPLTSGYQPLADLYGPEYFWPNITDYTRRLLDSQGPLVFVAAAGPAFLWRNRANGTETVGRRSILIIYTAFAIGVYLCYALYVPLDTWWTLRFLFPAFPVAFVFLGVALLNLPASLPAPARWLSVLVLVGTTVAHAVAFAHTNSLLDSTAEWRYATAGRYIAQRLPERAVLFSMLHAGSARYYSGRLTVRYDLIPPQLFERTIAHFQQQGFVPFLLLDDGERGHFVDRFMGATSLAALDWQPVAAFDGVAIYDVTAK